jgi:hypothetical protein
MPHGARFDRCRQRDDSKPALLLPIALEGRQWRSRCKATSRTFWLRAAQRRTDDVASPRFPGREPPALTVRSNQIAERIETLVSRWTDHGGERYRFDLPPVARDSVGRTADESRGKCAYRRIARRPVTGPVRLDRPRGWRFPAETTVTVTGGRAGLCFLGAARRGPNVVSPSRWRLDGDRASRQTGRTVIDHPIPVMTLPRRRRRVSFARTLKGGSRVDTSWAQGRRGGSRADGVQVTLSDDDIESTPLAPYDAIVVGIRAYNTRPRLRTMQDHLFDYVSNGGTLVVQYNTAEDALQDKLGPYPFRISRDRVTVEGSPVRFAPPDHPLLGAPNRIGAADFEGWVQERGLYFANPWNPKYETPLLMSDPGEQPTGGSLLAARHGKGTYIYTGISWFRQLPAGVPGAYRLFANLLGAGRK